MRACVYTLIIFFFWSVDSAIGCEEGAIRVLPCSVCFCIRGETKCSPGACLDINETLPLRRPGRSARKDDVCYQKFDIGPCDSIEERFGFDVEMGRCRDFVYGGCGGNSNNFETLEECKGACED
ncbi:uncharacterized protein LOC143032008 isoform X1 [Oratosquilla oratoria]|uniref:uncharacterized protein LOC143032008 isoform X1 n=1 Tax=Oratosquilla oratoria TaxID=337810 RepID=UPI003F771968